MVSAGDACLPEGVGRLGAYVMFGHVGVGRLRAYLMFGHVEVGTWESRNCLSVGRVVKIASSFALYILFMRCAVPRCMTPCAMP